MNELENAFNSLFSDQKVANTEKLAYVCEFDFKYFLNEFVVDSFKKVAKDGTLYGFDLKFNFY